MPVSEDDTRLARCGFAKLYGDGVEFFMRKYEITLGRKSKSTNLDVVLGENMNISRKHACVRYNFEKSCFELKVLGKNGVTVRGVLHTPASPPLELKSQDLIQMGDRSFYFLLPKDASRLGPPSKIRRTNAHPPNPSPHTPPSTNSTEFNSLGAPGMPQISHPHPQPGPAKPQPCIDGLAGSLPPPLLQNNPLGQREGRGMPMEVDVMGQSEGPRKRKSLSPDAHVDPQELVFTHPSPMNVQGAQLFHPGGMT